MNVGKKTFIKNVNLRKIQLVRITYKFKLKGIERTWKDRSEEMKLSKAMELLEEDPSRKFEYKNDRKKWILYADVGGPNGSVFYMLDCWDSKGELMTGTAFGGLHGNLTTSDNWQLVREPVTWQEAIEAWADGKTISYSYLDDDIRYGFEEPNTRMTVEKIKRAKWHVED